ncbi:extended synaptotagmin-1-like isoform X1 [Sinocyclocheilus rhinocerous]|uniref:extended synaptotagmin-1-like isoform X1 n=1 Tax=Sinocyclocheilus rhinocerous TaxID=307959 RepID=UPI0007B81790|nr:PREDICTED: extended synaptotagmin-1-like isoform X1 [Sinocyclocheilus rhinocerous]
MQKEPKSSDDAGPSAGAAPGAADSALPQDSAGKHAVSVLWSFGKCLGALLPVYLAGYFGFSICVVLLGLLVYMRWKHSRDGKQARLQSAMYFLENEQDVTTTRVFRSKRELPAWVNFPDVEKVEWMNKILQQAWPFIGQYLEKLLVETIAPSIRAASAHLQTLSFTKVDLGDRAMKVVGVKAYTEHDKRQVILDLYISYAGDVEINVEVKKYFCKAGVKGIQLHGRLRVILEPLIGDVPLVGAITMFFIRRPKLDINWTGLTNLLDIPGLNAMTDTMIMDAIASFLVLPNRLTVPLVANLHVAQLRSPLPRGIVRIHLLEAENLAAKDNYMKGVISGKSDPYAVLRVGTQTFTSHHVDNNLNPQWREMYEVIVHEVPGQELELEVFDKDPDQDDFLGRMKLDLGIVKKAVLLDEWYTLKDVPSGQVHLKLEWLSLLPSAERLNEVLERNKSITVYGKTADPPSAAILTVYLDRAQDLPFKKGNKDPSPMVQISVQDTTKESRTVYGTNNPVWEDAFTFFIQDPSKQDIDIQVKDDDRALTLGGLSIPLSRLLSSAELSMDQWFQLEKSGPASRIYITAMLRVLWLNEEAILTTPVSPLPGEGDNEPEVSPGLSKLTPTSKRPEHSSPDGNFASEGVLRIHLVEAQSLVAKDNLMGGMVKGKSDPYVKIRVGGLAFKSQVIKENLNPIWNELYEVILTQLPGQEVEFDLYDKDIDQDDFLGRVKVSLRDLISAQFTDQWYTLNDVKSGRLHLVLEWVPKVSDPTRLEQILHYNYQQSYLNKIVPSAALLFVYVERAHGLPLKKSGKEPKAGAEVSLKNVSRRTKVRPSHPDAFMLMLFKYQRLTKESCFSHKVVNRSTSPQWDEAFNFLMHNPSEDTLIVKLTHSWGQALGSLVLPVRELLDEKDLVLDRWFSLDGAMPESQILLRAELKLLDSKLAQCSDAEDSSHVIPSGDTAAAANCELRHRSVPVQGGEDASSTRKAQVKLSVAYLSEENRLFITVHACRNLPSFSKDPPDTYISFILLPDKNRNTKRKTSVKKKSLKPEFNERFDFDMTLEEAKQKHLEVSVKNSVSFMSREKELLGKLQLDLCQLDLKTGVSQWYDLSHETN